MPILLKKDRKHEAICDYCGNLHGIVDDSYLSYSGYSSGIPKFAIICNPCFKHAFDNYFRPGCLVRGYGPVSKERLDKMENQVQTAKAAARRSTNKVDATQLDWPAMDKLITDKVCRMNSLAESLNANPQELRTAFENHYGNRIVFKRGRSGGVFWVETQTATA